MDFASELCAPCSVSRPALSLLCFVKKRPWRPSISNSRAAKPWKWPDPVGCGPIPTPVLIHAPASLTPSSPEPRCCAASLLRRHGLLLPLVVPSSSGSLVPNVDCASSASKSKAQPTPGGPSLLRGLPAPPTLTWALAHVLGIVSIVRIRSLRWFVFFMDSVFFLVGFKAR
ncbi:uncharacterized protein LOC125543883 [Triticum urartu]|uniref:uncharacterized protein LOC125543883 n=1 Tax=Triticum urartu TaxID=4572 RepID=UPI0020448F90|nr:uncharacterized protein LOC125543883 [Triticum urartu]